MPPSGGAGIRIPVEDAGLQLMLNLINGDAIYGNGEAYGKNNRGSYPGCSLGAAVNIALFEFERHILHA